MKDIQAILDCIQKSCRNVLSSCLTGVYVHGSIAFGCFTWDRSDVDILVVVNRPLLLHEKTALLEALLAHEEAYPPKGLEMSVVLEKDCRDFHHPMHYELHYSPAHRTAYRDDAAAYCACMQGNDRDLAAHCTVIRHAGYALWGKPVADVFAPVPVSDYLDSLHYDIDSARIDILDNPMYIILNLCRVLAYVEDNAVRSKRQGGEWGIRRLEKRWEPLLQAALDDYAGCEHSEYESRDLTAFADEMCARINASSHSYA